MQSRRLHAAYCCAWLGDFAGFNAVECNAAAQYLERRIMERHEIVLVGVASEVRESGPVTIVDVTKPRRIDNLHHVVELESCRVKWVARQCFVVWITEASYENPVTMYDDIWSRDARLPFILAHDDIAPVALEAGRTFDSDTFCHGSLHLKPRCSVWLDII